MEDPDKLEVLKSKEGVKPVSQDYEFNSRIERLLKEHVSIHYISQITLFVRFPAPENQA